jgi:hypothetical protein
MLATLHNYLYYLELLHQQYKRQTATRNYGEEGPASQENESAPQIHAELDSGEFNSSCHGRDNKQSAPYEKHNKQSYYLHKILIENRVSPKVICEYILVVKNRIDLLKKTLQEFQGHSHPQENNSGSDSNISAQSANQPNSS